MTERAVEIIIQVKYDGISKEVKTSIGLDKLVTGMSRINKGFQQALATTLLEVTEESLHARVPKSWKNLGTAKRSLLTESGLICFKRHIYEDDEKQRRKR